MKKAVIITGAGSGIGEATCLEFAKNGYFIFLLGRRIEALQKVLSHFPNQGLALACDLKSLASVRSTVQAILNQADIQVTTLVNNAGVFVRKDFEESSDDLWIDQFDTNLFGAVRITREVYPFFKKQKSGSIINVSSTLGLSPSSGVSAYSASKAAMVNWTQTLALEGGPFGIRANCVCPGIVDTPIHAFHSLDKKEKSLALTRMQELQPLQRIGTSSEVAASIFFLGSEASAWTTGAVLSVDGGINLL